MSDALIFDLDGTLWDVRDAVAKARNNVIDLLQLKIEKFTADDVAQTMGLPVNQVYEIAFPNEKNRFAEIRSHLDPEIRKMIFAGNAALYPGVKEGIASLAKTRPLFIVSNCSEPYLETFFAWSGLRGLFKDSTCFGMNGLSKAENIAMIVARHGLKNCIYIGDTGGDQAAARTARVNYIHVSYGFGKPTEPCATAPTFQRLLEQL